jgi:radical SAM protein with 4Fe4S-binding SPASM domain
VEDCIRIKEELGLRKPLITVQVVLLQETMRAFAEIMAWAHSAGVRHVNVTRVNAILSPDLPRPDRNEEKIFFRTLGALRRKHHVRIDCFQDQMFTGMLGFLYRKLLPLASSRLEEWCIKWSYYLYVDVNGDLFPCSGLFPKEKTLGNIFRDEIASVWNGPDYRALRSSRARRIPCRYCDNMRVKQRVSPGYEMIRQSMRGTQKT